VYRDEGIEGVGNGEGVSPPSRLGGLGASEAPPVGYGAEPQLQTIFTVFEGQKSHMMASILVNFTQ